MCKRLLLMGLFCFSVLSGVRAQEGPRVYALKNGASVVLPERAFVDEVICPKESPLCPNRPIRIKVRNRPEDVIGPPPRRRRSRGGRRPYALGCGGYGIWKFTDNVLVDRPGPDLVVFERGTKPEPTSVEISRDGLSWILIGRVEGGTQAIDIANRKIKPSEKYQYVRLTDVDGSSCGGYPGADIIAIATYRLATTRTGGSDVLFAKGKSFLKPKGREYIDGIFADGPASGQRLIIVGHTDSDNLTGQNQKLSEDRAKAVATYIVEKKYMRMDQITTYGVGASQPVAPNTTVEGKARNRRVTLTFVSATTESSR